MKNEKKFKILTSIMITLIAVIFIIVGFVGIYLPKYNKISNIVPDLKLGTELDGVLECRFSPDTSETSKKVFVDGDGNIKGEVVENDDGTDPETSFAIEERTIKANEESSLTSENFEKVKEILSNRLEDAGATEYAIRMNNKTGDMVVELSNNDNTEFLYTTMLSLAGEFTIEDKQTGVILLENKHIKQAGAYLAQTSDTGYTVYLQLEFTEEGRKVFTDISNRYIKYVSTDGESQIDYISIQLDDSELMSTYFEEEYTESIVNIPIGAEVSDETQLNDYTESAEALASIINLGKLPVKYTSQTPLFVKSAVSENLINIVFIVMCILLAIILVIFTIKFKISGFVSGILNAGFIGTVIIVLKCLQVIITPGSLIALFIVILLNTIFLKLYLKNKEENPYVNTLKTYYLMIVPVIVVSFVFTFFASEAISGIGNVLLWSLLLQAIYNFVFTKFAINK